MNTEWFLESKLITSSKCALVPNFLLTTFVFSFNGDLVVISSVHDKNIYVNIISQL